MFFVNQKESTPNLSIASRYPIDKNTNKVNISGKFWKHENITKVHQEWINFENIRLQIVESKMLKDIKTLLIQYKKYLIMKS